MALKRYTKSVDGTIPVPALLYEDEVLLTSQEPVGIYDGYVHKLRKYYISVGSDLRQAAEIAAAPIWNDSRDHSSTILH